MSLKLNLLLSSISPKLRLQYWDQWDKHVQQIDDLVEAKELITNPNTKSGFDTYMNQYNWIDLNTWNYKIQDTMRNRVITTTINKDISYTNLDINITKHFNDKLTNYSHLEQSYINQKYALMNLSQYYTLNKFTKNYELSEKFNLHTFKLENKHNDLWVPFDIAIRLKGLTLNPKTATDFIQIKSTDEKCYKERIKFNKDSNSSLGKFNFRFTENFCKR
ncbi:hypothetical protein QEN19_000021 (mitochondrion) [Hanseniaspora menglaensis]